MTVESPRRILGFKRTTMWSWGLVQALVFGAIAAWLFLASDTGEWRHGLFVVGWFVAAILYGVALRNERRDFPEGT